MTILRINYIINLMLKQILSYIKELRVMDETEMSWKNYMLLKIIQIITTINCSLFKYIKLKIILQMQE